MDTLLFQNTPILWVGSWIPSLVTDLVMVGMTFLVFLMRKKYQNRPKRQTPSSYQWISRDDPDFRDKTLTNLKSYLLDRYVPHHVMAHTAEEIEKYVTPHELAEVLTTLELSLYSGTPWTRSDSEQIHTTLQQYIHD